MIKHVFMLLILLVRISVAVSGQADTTPISEDNNESVDIDKTFFDGGGRLSIGHFTFKDGLISSDVYSGNEFGGWLHIGAATDKFHIFCTLGLNYVPQLKLSAKNENAQNAVFQDVRYSRIPIRLQGEKRIAKSNHFLGGYVYSSIESLTGKTKNTNPYLSSPIPYKRDASGYLPNSIGASYFYSGKIFNLPLRVNLLASIPISTGNGVSTYYAFESYLVVYEKSMVRYAISYNWNYAASKGTKAPMYPYQSASNSIGLLILTE